MTAFAGFVATGFGLLALIAGLVDVGLSSIAFGTILLLFATRHIKRG